MQTLASSFSSLRGYQPSEAERAANAAAIERNRAAVEARHDAELARCRLARTRVPAGYRTARAEGNAWACAILDRLPRGTWLCGASGIGKTHAACAAAMELALRGERVRFVTAEQVLADARSLRDEGADVRAWWAAPYLLVVDDADKLLEARGFGVAQLFAISDARQGMPTVWTANVGYRELAAGITAAAGAGRAAPIVSRIQGACGAALVATGRDLRLDGWS